VSAKPKHEHPVAAQAAPALSELDLLVRAFASGQLAAQKTQACLRQSNCDADSAQLIDALERSLRAMKKTAALADGGNTEAAFQRGRMSLWISGELSQQASDLGAGGSAHQATVLSRRERSEIAVAEHYFSQAAARGHPGACLALAEGLARRGSGDDALLVPRLFRCAVSGYMAARALGDAQRALTLMQRHVPASNADLVEAHAAVYRLAAPTAEATAR
jgi:hypothetical protein